MDLWNINLIKQELVMRCIDEFGDSYPDDEDEWYPKKDEMFQFYFYP